MEQQKIQMFLMSNQKNFEASQLPIITEKLEGLDDDKLMFISSANYKDPTTMLIISLFLGGLGVDRFMLGETGMGVLKLLTGGCLGVLTIIDWFTVMGRTRERNFNVFMESIENQSMLFSSKTDDMRKLDDSSVIEEIKKYKDLLDNSIITQEEFNRKKAELLNK